MRKLGRLLWIIISVVMTGLAISFTVSNDAVIALSLWPFSQILNIPTWLSVIAAFVIGGSLERHCISKIFPGFVLNPDDDDTCDYDRYLAYVFP